MAKREIRVHGHRRSGHNGVLAWVSPHYGVEPLVFRHMTVVSKSPAVFHWQRPQPEGDPLHMVVTDATVFPGLDPKFDLPWDAGHYLDAHLWREYDAEVTEFFVIRDPYNCFASAVKKFGMEWTMFSSHGKIWKHHARMVLSGVLEKQGMIVTLFDQWRNDKSHREEMSRKMGRPFTDEGFNKVRQASSFQFHDRDARKLSLFDRWKTYKDDDDYKSMFDDEIHGLAETLFGKWATEVRSQLT